MSALLVVGIAGGCVALALRPTGSFAAVTIIIAVGVIGFLAPGPRPAPVERPTWPAGTRWMAAMGVGLGALAISQTQSHVDATPLWLPAVAASLFAAVAEEGFFRRLVYGALIRWGPVMAIGGAAVLFAVVHVPAYGAAVLPINITAGLLFGWQRWATGGWSAPALTHVAANLLHYTNLLSVG